jgi:TatD DNase family protein
MIDSHAHIYSEKFKDDLPATIARAQQVGITKIIMPNTDSESIVGMLAMEQAYPDLCVATIGLHPCYVNENFEKELAIVEDWLAKRTFVAIGEMGLDLYWDKTFYPQQQEAFSIQAAWAKKYNLPLIIHTRECMSETIEIIEKLQDGTLYGVVHCFSGDLAQALRLIELGFVLGIGGVVTYPKAGLQQVIPYLPIEKIILETDSPYLAPIPHRGKRNEPAYTQLVAQKIAELKNISAEEVTTITDQNCVHLFKL